MMAMPWVPAIVTVPPLVRVPILTALPALMAIVPAVDPVVLRLVALILPWLLVRLKVWPLVVAVPKLTPASPATLALPLVRVPICT